MFFALLIDIGSTIGLSTAWNLESCRQDKLCKVIVPYHLTLRLGTSASGIRLRVRAALRWLVPYDSERIVELDSVSVILAGTEA